VLLPTQIAWQELFNLFRERRRAAFLSLKNIEQALTDGQ
jgi:hypothetical protein